MLHEMRERVRTQLSGFRVKVLMYWEGTQGIHKPPMPLAGLPAVVSVMPDTGWGCEGSSPAVPPLPKKCRGCGVCSASSELMANLIQTPAAWTLQNTSPSSSTCWCLLSPELPTLMSGPCLRPQPPPHCCSGLQCEPASVLQLGASLKGVPEPGNASRFGCAQVLQCCALLSLAH